MTEFKAGDRVRVKDDVVLNNGQYRGKPGVVTRAEPGYYIRVNLDNDPESNLPVHASEIELVEPQYDQDTVNAIVKHLRDTPGYAGSAAMVEEAFAVPKTRTVTVNFQVPDGKSVVDYLENIGIDYDIEGGN